MDDAEFWEFYARYRGIALRAAKTILKNEAEAEDVCQDIFETLYHMEQDKVNRQTMGAMIREMSVNRAKDYCKKDTGSMSMPVLSCWKITKRYQAVIMWKRA